MKITRRNFTKLFGAATIGAAASTVDGKSPVEIEDSAARENFMSQQTSAKTSQRTINIDCKSVKGATSRIGTTVVGAGRANEGLRAEWQKQLITTKKECGFEYIRFHGLLHEDMGVYKEDDKGNPIYNWQYVDMLYDFLVEIGMKPIVEFFPTPLDLKTGEETVFWWKANITPPKDYQKWANLVRGLTAHWRERYGHETVKTWYFEVWNEPNLTYFFTGKQADYFKLYKAAAEAVKSVSAEYRVGGPATAGSAWISDLINFCKETNTPLDFISTHSYGNEGEFDADNKSYDFKIKDVTALYKSVQKSKAEITAAALPKLELHYTEWSASFSPLDPIHDVYQNAPYILNTLKNSEGFADTMSYWTFTDIFEESNILRNPFRGCFGMMNLQGIRKPAFYAFKYLNQLGATELKNSDAQSWATRDDRGGVQVLFYDLSLPDLTNASSYAYYTKDNPAKDKGAATVKISNLENGKYVAAVYSTGYRRNDPYTIYFDLDKPANLSVQQREILEKSSADAPVKKEIVNVTNGVYTTALPYRENDVYFVKLEKLNG